MATEPYEAILQDEDGNDVNMRAQIKRIPVDAEPLFDNAMGDYYTTADQSQFGGNVKIGNVKNLALHYGLKTLETDIGAPGTGQLKTVKISEQNPYSSLPDLRDDEGEYGPEGDSIADVVIRAILNSKPNRSFAKKQMYQIVFQRYLDPKRGEKKDPTEPTSTNGSTDTSVAVVPQTTTETPSSNASIVQ